MKEWTQFLESLKKDLGEKPVEDWLKPLKIVRFDAGNLYLEAPSPLHISWFDEYAKPKAIERLKSSNHRTIKIHWVRPQNNFQTTQKAQNLFQSDSFDPTSTLDCFLKGEKNKIAYSVFTQWTASGRIPFNPLFLFGPVNSGKTHLLMAMANHFSKSKKVLFVKANTFTEHLVSGIRSGQMDLFRKTYREVDLLIVDQIEQIAGRTSTQEEFFHTFNTLHMQGKEILLASRFAPSKIDGIEPRLISRFEWGLSIEIGPADVRDLILKKTSQWALQLDSSLIDFLASKFEHDPITPLQALSIRAPKGVKISKESALRLLQDLIQASDQKAPSFEEILEQVANHFSITAGDITGKSQRKEHAFPRQIAMYLCRERLKMAYQAIGKLFGRDHSTVMGSVKQIEEKIAQKDPSVMSLF